MARIDRRLEGITKILKIGMRQMVKLGESQRRTDAKMGELADAPKVTELKLQAFIDSLQKGRNGN